MDRAVEPSRRIRPSSYVAPLIILGIVAAAALVSIRRGSNPAGVGGYVLLILVILLVGWAGPRLLNARLEEVEPDLQNPRRIPRPSFSYSIALGVAAILVGRISSLRTFSYVGYPLVGIGVISLLIHFRRATRPAPPHSDHHPPAGPLIERRPGPRNSANPPDEG